MFLHTSTHYAQVTQWARVNLISIACYLTCCILFFCQMIISFIISSEKREIDCTLSSYCKKWVTDWASHVPIPVKQWFTRKKLLCDSTIITKSMTFSLSKPTNVNQQTTTHKTLCIMQNTNYKICNRFLPKAYVIRR